MKNNSKNWIKDAIKNKGGLRKSLNKSKDEKITKDEIDFEIEKLKKKDKDKSKIFRFLNSSIAICNCFIC